MFCVRHIIRIIYIFIYISIYYLCIYVFIINFHLLLYFKNWILLLLLNCCLSNFIIMIFRFCLLSIFLWEWNRKLYMYDIIYFFLSFSIFFCNITSCWERRSKEKIMVNENYINPKLITSILYFTLYSN